MAEWYVYVWIVLVSAGLLLVLWFEYDAWRDLQFLREKGINGNRGMIAIGNLRSGLIRIIIQLTFVMIGVTILLDSPWRRAWTINGLLLVATLLIVDSVHERWDRQALLNAYRDSDS